MTTKFKQGDKVYFWGRLWHSNGRMAYMRATVEGSLYWEQFDKIEYTVSRFGGREVLKFWEDELFTFDECVAKRLMQQP